MSVFEFLRNPFRGRAGRKATEEQTEGRAKSLFEDLLNLEINVIATPGMTARKMPEPRAAFSNIAEAYEDLLIDFTTLVLRDLPKSSRIKILTQEEAAARSPSLADRSMVNADGHLIRIEATKLVGGHPLAGVDSFAQLREWAVEANVIACALIARAGWPSVDELNAKVVLLKRIYRNCDQLMPILVTKPHEGDVVHNEGEEGSGTPGPRVDLKRDVDLGLTPNELITLRKIWEIGTSTVVMQTVVQIDGDIVTRIHEGHAVASSKPLHDLHRDAVEGAIRNWQYLGQTVTQFLTSILKKFM